MPELQALLDLFKPKALAPNTLLPSLKGADYYAMIAAFGECLAPGGKEELRASCLGWFKREKGLKTEQEVCAFARQAVLFQAGPSDTDALDLRPGRSANRQRQSEVFLPSLPFATKGTVNSPKAHSIPAAPVIVVSPGAVSLKASVALGRIDVDPRDDDYYGGWEDTQEVDQDTQMQKSREARRTTRATPVVAPVKPGLEASAEESQENSKEEPEFIVFPACVQAERILKELPARSISQRTTRKDAVSVTVSITPSNGTDDRATGSASASKARISSSNLRPGKRPRNMR